MLEDLEGEVDKNGLRKKDIGGWIRKYKAKRGWRLICIGLILLAATGLAHKKLWLSCTWVKASLYISIFIGMIYSLYQHIADQKDTLEKLE